jgi:uncharacterized protein (UPF0332 family)
MWDWEDYLDLAYWLADHVDEHMASVQPGVLHDDGYSIGKEALFRASISRAYYAAHHLARAYVADVVDLPVNFDSAHKHVVMALGLKDAASDIEVEISDNLQKLRRLREYADYKRLDRPENTADKALEHAQAVCDRLKVARNLEPPPKRYRDRNPGLVWPPPPRQ